jgi:class 3 adenylate cyclase
LASERVERRLTAILAADVAGYSRLTGADEEGTHAQLQDHLRSLVDPKIAEHRGRVAGGAASCWLGTWRKRANGSPRSNVSGWEARART